MRSRERGPPRRPSSPRLWHTQPAAAVDALRSALAGMQAAADGSAGRLRLELLLAETTAAILPPAEIEQQLHELADAAPPGSPLRQVAACVLMWHHELWSTHPDRAVIHGLAEELRDPQPLIRAYGADFAPVAMAAGVLGDRDQHDAAARLFDAVAEESQRGHNAFALNLAVVRAYATALEGKFADAEAQARAALERAVATGSRTGLRAALHGLVWALIGRGADTEIDAILTEQGLDSDVDRGGSSTPTCCSPAASCVALRGATARRATTSCGPWTSRYPPTRSTACGSGPLGCSPPRASAGKLSSWRAVPSTPGAQAASWTNRYRPALGRAGRSRTLSDRAAH